MPALHVSGWFDTYLSGSVAGFLCHGRACANTSTWSPVPGSISRGENWSASRIFGPEALLDTDSLLLRWFNHWLKNSGELLPSRASATLPWALIAGSMRRPFRKRASPCICIAQAAPFAQRRWLLSTAIPNETQPRDIFVYDPETPVLGPGGPAALAGPINQAATRNRQQPAGLHALLR